MMRRAAFLMVLLGGVACSGKEFPVAQERQPAGDELLAHLPEGHHLRSLHFPIFSDDAEAQYSKLRLLRKSAGLPETKLTDKIQWAKNLDDAFARAKAEDKPVLLVTFVRENGDPHCDV